nr:hypothetical protein [Nostoc sp. FACHB-892]
MEYVGSGSVITLFLIFAMHFTNKNRWLTPQIQHCYGLSLPLM